MDVTANHNDKLNEEEEEDGELHDIGVEGSDMTRDIQVALSKENPLRVVRSMPQSEFILYQDIGKASDYATPGGFRRGHVLHNLEDGETAPPAVYKPFMEGVQRPNRLQAAVQQLEDTYDDFVLASFEVGMNVEDFEDSQRTPLLRQQGEGLHSSSVSKKKGSSVKKTVFTILKSFIGSGILFLPKGFENGGMAFSITILILSAVLSTFCMLRLASCSKAVSASTGTGATYGMLGERAFGKIGRLGVNISLVLSQLGFCCSYLIFIERNVRDVIMHVTNCKVIPGPWWLIILQIPVYTPLSWVRKIKYFAMTNLLADVLVLFGLIYIMSYSIEHIVENNDRTADWHNFNEKSWPLFLGTAVYVFEGIGLVLPIHDAMDKSVRDRFPVVLSKTIVFLVTLFISFASIVYAAFGSQTQSVVTLNLPSQGINAGRISVQVAYCIALVFTYPLMLYPAMMILEGYCVASATTPIKGALRWKKNIFRFTLVCLTASISILCMEELDNFVALIGGFCSVPLAFIFPCMFHTRLVGTGKSVNYFIIVIGILTMVFSTYQAISTWETSGKAVVEYCAAGNPVNNAVVVGPQN